MELIIYVLGLESQVSHDTSSTSPDTSFHTEAPKSRSGRGSEPKIGEETSPKKHSKHKKSPKRTSSPGRTDKHEAIQTSADVQNKINDFSRPAVERVQTRVDEETHFRYEKEKRPLQTGKSNSYCMHSNSIYIAWLQFCAIHKQGWAGKVSLCHCLD